MFFNMKEIVSYTINSPDTCFQLTVLFFRFIHVVTCGWNSFSLLCEITLYEQTIIYPFYCQWTFGLFPAYAIVNSIITSIIIYMFPSPFLHKNVSRVLIWEQNCGFLDYKYSGFLENSKLFTQVVVSV